MDTQALGIEGMTGISEGKPKISAVEYKAFRERFEKPPMEIVSRVEGASHLATIAPLESMPAPETRKRSVYERIADCFTNFTNPAVRMERERIKESRRLFAAVKDGNFDDFNNILLEGDFNVEYVDPKTRMNLLTLSIYLGRKEFYRALLQHPYSNGMLLGRNMCDSITVKGDGESMDEAFKAHSGGPVKAAIFNSDEEAVHLVLEKMEPHALAAVAPRYMRIAELWSRHQHKQKMYSAAGKALLIMGHISQAYLGALAKCRRMEVERPQRESAKFISLGKWREMQASKEERPA